MIPLRQSTASQIIQLGGVFVDSGDGDTEETALTIANTDIKLHKSGATSLTSKNSGGGTHMANGRYYATFDATDTNTVGPLTITIHVSGALVETIHCFVFEEAIYDALYASGATGALPATLVQGGINTTAGTITTLDDLDTAQDSRHNTTQTYLSTNLGNLGANATEAGGTGDQFTALALSAAGVSAVQSGLATPTNITAGTITTVTGNVGGSVGSVTGNVGGNVVGSVGSVTGHTPQTGDTYVLANGATGFTAIDTVVDSILEDTGTTIPATIATAQDDLNIITGTDGALIDSANDVYHAMIEYVFDSPVDEYTVTWFRNGERVTSGITSPVIQIVKRADGTDLVASTAMAQIGTTGSYKYDESTNTINANESYLAVTSATIGSGSRSFACLVSRLS